MQEILQHNMDFNMDYVRVNRFDEESASKFHLKITRLSNMDPTHPIIVYIDSYGGNVDALASMIETISAVPNKIVTVCVGKAMSCGAILLAAGDYRFCGKNSRVLIHEVQSGLGGDPYDIKSTANEIMRFNEYWLDFFAKKCGLEGYAAFKEILNQHIGREINFNAQGAKNFGIVDDIGIPVIRPLIMYHIDLLEEKNDDKLLNKDNIDDTLGLKSKKKKKKKKATKKAKK